MSNVPATTTPAIVEPKPLTKFQQNVVDHIRAGFQLMLVVTAEEAHVDKELRAVTTQVFNLQHVNWDCHMGFTGFQNPPADLEKRNSAELRNPAKAVEFVLNLPDRETSPGAAKQSAVNAHAMHENDGLFVFRDLDDFWKNDPVLRRQLEAATEYLRSNNTKRIRPIIVVSSRQDIPEKLKHLVKVIEYDLPTLGHITQSVLRVHAALKKSIPTTPDIDPDHLERIARTCLGLTSYAAENILSMAATQHVGFPPEMLHTLQRSKAEIVRTTGNLTYISPDGIAARNQIGGYDLYLDWLARRATAYSVAAKAQQIDAPRGVVLLGPPGTGKSMVAKLTCDVLGLPGYIIDIGSLFGSLVGESEERTRTTLRQLDAQQGCVAVFDEADKALSRAHEASGDSGATQRVFATLLTWLTESKSNVFSIMTLNRVDGIPPELLRPGRFDAIFYTALPSEAERKMILNIHFQKRGVSQEALNLDASEWQELLAATSDFTGAELEQVVLEARYAAWDSRRQPVPTFDELCGAAKRLVCMAKRDPQEVQKIAEFCSNIGQPVTSQESGLSTSTARRRRSQAAGPDERTLNVGSSKVTG